MSDSGAHMLPQVEVICLNPLVKSPKLSWEIYPTDHMLLQVKVICLNPLVKSLKWSWEVFLFSFFGSQVKYSWVPVSLFFILHK